ncbi:MAG: hypothetical protein WAV22_05300 [Porticoccaceae bacterium]
MLLGANPKVHGKLEQAGILQLMRRENRLTAFGDALAVCQTFPAQPPETVTGWPRDAGVAATLGRFVTQLSQQA